MEKIRVVLVDDHTLIRQGMRLFLSSERDIEVVGDAGDVSAAQRVVGATQPDVVLMDLSLGTENSLGLTRQIKLTRPSLRILAVTAHADDAAVTSMLNAGADGYVLKDVAMDELAQAVRAVARGHFVLHPSIARRWATVGRQEVTRADDSLTPRELEILQLLAGGATSKEIARQLSLSVKTVENHRANILAKLRARNTAELISLALERGLIHSRIGDQAFDAERSAR